MPEQDAARPFRMLQDNVLVRLKPRPKLVAGGLIQAPDNAKAKLGGLREAEVIAVGPGHHPLFALRCAPAHTLAVARGPFQATEVQPGDVVVVDEAAGQDYRFDVSAPRANPAGADGSWIQGSDCRIVREDEILFVDEAPNADGTSKPWEYGGRQ